MKLEIRAIQLVNSTGIPSILTERGCRLSGEENFYELSQTVKICHMVSFLDFLSLKCKLCDLILSNQLLPHECFWYVDIKCNLSLSVARWYLEHHSAKDTMSMLSVFPDKNLPSFFSEMQTKECFQEKGSFVLLEKLSYFFLSVLWKYFASVYSGE